MTIDGVSSRENIRGEAAARAAARIAEANVERGDSFQDFALAEIRLALDILRGEGSDAPHIGSGALAPEREGADPTGDDPLIRALLALGRELDASQETIARHCDRVRRVALERT